MAIVAVSSSGNVKTKNKKMEYIVNDRNVKKVRNMGHRLLHETKEFRNGMKNVILSEEDAQELRNHGYIVEENKKVYSSMIHKRRHLQTLTSGTPSSTEEHASWGRAFAFGGDASWFDSFRSITPSNPVKICVASSGVDKNHEDLPSDRIIGQNVAGNPEAWDEDATKVSIPDNHNQSY